MERAIYTCPFCGLSELESHGDLITCKTCSREVRYLPTKELEGVGFEFPHRFVAEWYDAQAAFINGLDVTESDQTELFCDTVDFYQVIPYEKKLLLGEDIALSLYGTHIRLAKGEECAEWRFDELSAITVLGKNKLNIYRGDKLYQVKGGKRFNALKYVHIFHRYKNIAKGEQHEQFLGL